MPIGQGLPADILDVADALKEAGMCGDARSPKALAAFGRAMLFSRLMPDGTLRVYDIGSMLVALGDYKANATFEDLNGWMEWAIRFHNQGKMALDHEYARSLDPTKLRPIVLVDETVSERVVLDGNHRLYAAWFRGAKEWPVYQCDSKWANQFLLPPEMARVIASAV